MFRSVPVIAVAGLLSATFAVSAHADGDVAKGKRVFNKCKSCHELTQEKNKIGPHLVGIFGRKAGSVAGFSYSSAMKSAGIVWDEKTLDSYVADPKKFVPGNKMVLAPLKKEDDRENLIAYIKSEQKK